MTGRNTSTLSLPPVIRRRRKQVRFVSVRAERLGRGGGSLGGGGLPGVWGSGVRVGALRVGVEGRVLNDDDDI